MKRYAIVLTSLAPPPVPSRRRGPPLRRRPEQSDEWKPGTPGERAAVLALVQLRTLTGHIRSLFSDKFSALKGVLQSISDLEETLSEVEGAIQRGQLSVGSARLDDDEACAWLEDALGQLDGEAAFDGEDGTTDFALAMVEYWVYDVLRSQGFAFLSVLTGSIGPFEVIESFEQLEQVRYPY